MKKTVLVLVILTMILSLSLFGCNATKSSKVIPENRSVDSIDLLVFNSADQSVKCTLADVERDKLIEMFDNLGYMDRLYITNPVSSESFEYSLTINVAKKGLKKAYSYYVYIDRTSSYNVNGKNLVDQRDELYLRIETDSKKYEGKCNQEIINYLKQLKANSLVRG